MPIRNGRVVAALGGLTAALTLFTSALGQTDSEPPSGDSQRQGEAAQDAKPATAPKSPPAAPVASQPNPGDGKRQAREAAPERDLKGFARWAWGVILDPDNTANFFIMLFTLALTVVAVLQHRLEARTARETAEALNIAKETAAASQRSAEIAERALTATVRPHLLVDRIELADTGLGNETYELSIGMTNAGQSPAFIRTHQAYFQLCPPALEPVWEADGGALHTAIIPILPTRTQWLHFYGDNTPTIPKETWDKIRRGELLLYVVAAIHYQDSRGHPFETRFVYRQTDRGFEPHPSDEIWFYSAA